MGPPRVPCGAFRTRISLASVTECTIAMPCSISIQAAAQNLKSASASEKTSNRSQKQSVFNSRLLQRHFQIPTISRMDIQMLSTLLVIQARTMLTSKAREPRTPNCFSRRSLLRIQVHISSTALSHTNTSWTAMKTRTFFSLLYQRIRRRGWPGKHA